ncbi:MAG: hypothetical protein EOO44_21870, partial [Flavobacterium sp.]
MEIPKIILNTINDASHRLSPFFSNLFYKSDTLCVSGFKNKKSVNLLEKLYNKKSDHLTFLNIFSEYKKSSDKVEWAKKYGVKLNLLNKVNELS